MINHMSAESILEVVKELDDAFNRRDIEAVLGFYENEATMVVEPGRFAYGKAELRKVFETLFKMGGVAKQDKMKVIEAGDIALFISKWHLVKSSTDEREASKSFYATCVFRRSLEGKWRLIIDNSFGPSVLGE